jgi:hypothetical protein
MLIASESSVWPAPPLSAKLRLARVCGAISQLAPASCRNIANVIAPLKAKLPLL